MKEKIKYDKNRHYDILIDGKKTKILGYSMKTAPSGKKYIVIRTKVTGNALTDCNIRAIYTLEIPTDDGIMRISGKCSCHCITEVTFEIISLDQNRRDISINTIKRFCDGLEITLGEFFSTPDFEHLEQELQ